jgi:hypothetical protein
VDEFLDAFGETLHGVGGRARIGGILGTDEQCDFAFGGALFERSEKFGKLAAAEFFVELGDFAGDAGGAVAENFAGVGDAFGDAMRGFVKNDGAVLDAQALEDAAAFAGAVRQKTHEQKFFVGQAAGREGGEECGWSGHRNDRDMVPQTKSDKAMSGIGDQRHASVADESDFRALLERDKKFRRAGQFIVLVVADERLANLEVGEQLLRVACVLAGNLVDFLEDAKGAEGHVLEIANRGADEVQAAQCGLCFVRSGAAHALSLPRAEEVIVPENEKGAGPAPCAAGGAALGRCALHAILFCLKRVRRERQCHCTNTSA